MDEFDKLTADKTVDQLIEDAHEEISALCHGKRWRMSIPVQANDSDIILSNALRAATKRNCSEDEIMNVFGDQINENKNSTFFGGKDGYDYICFNDKGEIECSGTKGKMLEYANKFGWAVAILIPVAFSSEE